MGSLQCKVLRRRGDLPPFGWICAAFGEIFPHLSRYLGRNQILQLTVSEEEDEILRSVCVELLQRQSVLQRPLSPRVPKLGILLLFCVLERHQRD